MSAYCRFSSGDVHMYPQYIGGIIECCACLLAPMIEENAGPLADLMGMTPETHPEMYENFQMFDTLQFNTRTEAIEHLLAHRAAGHRVSEYAIELLRKELENEGEHITKIINSKEIL